MKMPNDMVRKMRRFPTKRIKHINITSAINSVNPEAITFASDEMGLSYALKTPTRYGRIEWAPVNESKNFENLLKKVKKLTQNI